MDKTKIAIIRVHGKKGLRKSIKNTFNMLRLYNKHNCVIIPNTKTYVGMIKRINEFVTWGEINKETLTLLLKERGKLARKKSLTEEYIKGKLKISLEEFASQVIEFKQELKNLPGLKLFFKLSPPKGGFERGGIKKQFALGGASGYRKEKINDLIKKMI